MDVCFSLFLGHERVALLIDYRLDLRRVGLVAKMAWPGTDSKATHRSYARMSAFASNWSPKARYAYILEYNFKLRGHGWGIYKRAVFETQRFRRPCCLA